MSDRDRHSEITQEKMLLRQQYIAARKGLIHGKRQAKDRAILETLQGLDELSTPNHVFTYISCGFEPDTHALIDYLLKRGIRVSVPLILKGVGIIAVDFPGWDHLKQGPMGIPQPDGGEKTDDLPEVCITPGVCFSDTGVRLGYGGGFYDRWLGQHRATHRIGLTYESNIAPELPLESHDMTMDIIVTEKRLIRIG